MFLFNNILIILTWIAQNWLFVIGFFVVLVFLVVIHEFGHFFAARKFNIKVLEFGFGIPPRAFGRKVGETLVSVNWLPLGGFVRLLGEDDSDAEVLKNKHSFAAQNVWKRILVVVAGIAINIIFSWILFWIVLFNLGFKDQFQLLNDFKFTGVKQVNEQIIFVSAVGEKTPAAEAGITPGERILQVNTVQIESVESLQKEIAQNLGKKITLKLSDQNKESVRDLEVTPRENPPQGEGPLGVGLGELAVATVFYETPVQKIFSGPLHAYNYAAYSLSALGSSFNKAAEEKNPDKALDNVSGLIGIAVVSKMVAENAPLIELIKLIALVSLTLGVMNLLPIPALDGGRLFFLLIEAITGKKVPPAIENRIHAVGMLFLLALMVVVTWKDIQKFIIPNL